MRPHMHVVLHLTKASTDGRVVHQHVQRHLPLLHLSNVPEIEPRS